MPILPEEGGIFADIDTLFLRPFPQEWRSREFILGREKAPALAGEGGSRWNVWIAAAPEAEFSRRWLGGLSLPDFRGQLAHPVGSFRVEVSNERSTKWEVSQSARGGRHASGVLARV